MIDANAVGLELALGDGVSDALLAMTREFGALDQAAAAAGPVPELATREPRVAAGAARPGPVAATEAIMPEAMQDAPLAVRDAVVQVAASSIPPNFVERVAPVVPQGGAMTAAPIVAVAVVPMVAPDPVAAATAVAPTAAGPGKLALVAVAPVIAVSNAPAAAPTVVREAVAERVIPAAPIAATEAGTADDAGPLVPDDVAPVARISTDRAPSAPVVTAATDLQAAAPLARAAGLAAVEKRAAPVEAGPAVWNVVRKAEQAPGAVAPRGAVSEAAPQAPAARHSPAAPAARIATEAPSAPGAEMPAERPAAPAASAQDGGRSGGDVMLDGRLVGHWLADRMGRDAGRPSAGTTHFNPRQAPAWKASGAL